MEDRRKRILTNEYEEATDIALAESALKCNARVYPKVRVADALDVNHSGLTDDEFSYSLKAHFDFLVARNGFAAFAVEFDGPQHDREMKAIRRDALKESICNKLRMPLLRIDAGFLRRIGRFSLVGWLVEVWFIYDEFCAAQERGEIAFDEDFDPRFVLSDDITKPEITFPYDPFRSARLHLLKYQGQLICQAPAHLMATDNLGYAVAVVLAEMLTGGFIIGTARCRNFSFPPMMPIELAMDLAVADAVEKIKRHQKGRLHLATQNEAEAWKKRIATWKAYK